MNQTIAGLRLHTLPAVPPAALRISRIVALAIIVAFTIADVVWAVTDWHLHDMNVYWTAGEQWRLTGNPYTLVPGVTDNSVYRYAPWFAALWVPLTLLPRLLVNVLWSGVLIVASFTAVWPLVRRGGAVTLPFAILMWGILFGMAAGGNSHGLVIALLVFGVERRSGPLWIAIAGSLKVVPFLYVLVYVGRREWGKAVATTGLTAILTAPIFLFERPALSSEFGLSNSLWSIAPWLWIGTVPVAVAIGAFVAIRWNRYAWPTLGTVCNLVLPRLFIYDVTFLLPGLAETVERISSKAHGTADRRAQAAG